MPVFGISKNEKTRVTKSPLAIKKEARGLSKQNEYYQNEDFAEFKEDEIKSLQELVFLLKEASLNPPMKLLIDSLNTLKLQPIILKDRNAYSGELSIVRTEATLEGTRYIHAQYFSETNGEEFLQHLSFEFRAGKHSFELVRKMIEDEFQIKADPAEENADFVSWKIQGRSVWIKKLDLEDMKSKSPFNSYDRQKDVGTIRITNEAEIH